MKKLFYLLAIAAILIISCTSQGNKAPEVDNSFAEEFQRVEDSIKQVIDEEMSQYPKDSSNSDYLIMRLGAMEGNPAPRRGKVEENL